MGTGEIAVSISVLIAVIGCLIGISGWLKSRDKDAEWKGAVNAKLDTLLKFNDKIDVLQTRQSQLEKEIGVVENSVKQAHKRIDGIREVG